MIMSLTFVYICTYACTKVSRKWVNGDCLLLLFQILSDPLEVCLQM